MAQSEHTSGQAVAGAGPETTANIASLSISDTPSLTRPADESRAESFVSASSTPIPTSEITPATTTAVSIEQQVEPKEWHPPTDGPQKLPIPCLSPKARVPERTPITADQEVKYATVLAAVSTWKTVPESTAKNAAQAPLQEHERMFLTRECLLRYLRATKWNTAQAIKRLQSTLSWRREYGADKFTRDYISPESETGKQFIIGFDIDGRPCLYMNPSRQNTKFSERQLHHLSYMVDRAIDMMPPGQEKTAILVSFKGTATRDSPPITVARSALNILQNHNPERLGRALVIDMPWFINTFFKLLYPFIDPMTKEKIKFNDDLKKFVPAEQLWKDFGGDLDFDYEHSVYWPALHEETDRRRKAFIERWEAGGRMIGEYEDYLRGGDQRPLKDILAEGEKEAADGEATVA